MNESKKSQIAIFVIISVVLLIGAVFVLYVSGQKQKKVQQNLKADSIDEAVMQIENYVSSYLKNVADENIRKIALNGGTFLGRGSRKYYNVDYVYLCRQVLGRGCVNLFVNRDSMERELSEAIKKNISKIDFSAFENQGYKVNIQEYNVSVFIGTDETEIILNMPVEIIRGDSSRHIEKFNAKSTLKLGKLFDLATQILNNEIKYRHFDEDAWMRKYSEISIEKHKPYPDVVYSLVADSDNPSNVLTFNFAVEGKDIASNPALGLKKDEIYGICYSYRDSNCFVNVERTDCNKILGVWSEKEDSRYSCQGISRFKERRKLLISQDCGVHREGTSWCEYDGIAGAGFDPVGSRHFKKSCFDGKIYSTECADYREEICTEYEPGKAVCRPNRWQDCTLQENKKDCENFNLRDCYWVDYLDKSSPERTVTFDYSNRKCIPYVPPGFKFWKGAGLEVCRLANEQRNCLDDSLCPQSWVDSTAMYCYFMGDCGNYFNFLKVQTNNGFYNTDDYINSYIYEIPLSKKQPYLIKIPNSLNQELTGNEFVFRPGEPSYINRKVSEYLKRISTTNHLFFSLIPLEVKIDIDSLHTATCGLWKAPLDSPDCFKCNDLENQGKPCSEYRCRSIGSNCIYTEENGIGKCSFSPYKQEDYGFSIEGAYILKNDVLPKTIMESSLEKGVKLGDYEKRIEMLPTLFRGKFGYSIEDVKPNSKILFVAKSNVKMQCRNSGMSYSTENVFFLDNISNIVPILIDARSLLQFEDESYLNRKFGMNNLLAGNFDIKQNIDLSMNSLGMLDQESMIDLNYKISSLGAKHGFKFSDTHDALKQSSELYETKLKGFVEKYKKEELPAYLLKQSGNDFAVIECYDTNNVLIGSIFLVYHVIDKDEEKPKILDMKVENKGNQMSVKFAVNEPVECRYGKVKESFKYLKNKITCDSISDYGVYYCYKDGILPEEKYFSCIDQPVYEEIYYINLKKSDVKNISGNSVVYYNNTIYDYDGLEFKDEILYVINADALKEDKVIYVDSNSINIELNFASKKRCRLAETIMDFDDAPLELKCDIFEDGKYKCRTKLLFDNELKYTMICRNDIVEKRNEVQFSVS